MAAKGVTFSADGGEIIPAENGHPVHRGPAQHEAIAACEFPVAAGPLSALTPAQAAHVVEDGVLVHVRRLCWSNSDAVGGVAARASLATGWTLRNNDGKLCVVLGDKDYVAVVDDDPPTQYCVFYAPGPLC